MIFNDEPVLDDRRPSESEGDRAVFSLVPIDIFAKPHERALSVGLITADGRLSSALEIEFPQ